MMKRPLFPLLAAWVAGVLLASLTSYPVAVGLLLIAAGMAGFFIVKRHGSFMALAFMIAGLAVLRSYSFSQPPRYDLSRFAAGIEQPGMAQLWHGARTGEVNATVIGRLVEDPREYPNRTSFALNVDAAEIAGKPVPAAGNLLVNVYPPQSHGQPLSVNFPPLTFGERVKATGELRLPARARNPGEFDYRSYLARQGIHAILRVKESPIPLSESRRFSWIGFCLTVKRRMETALRATLPPSDATLMAGLLFSEQGRLPQTVQEEFVRTGTVHLLSTSGIHVAALAVALNFLFGRFRLRLKRPFALFFIALLFAFEVMAGGRPAVMRAVLMAALVYGAEIVDRDADGMNLLCFAALALLVVQPQNLYDLGFQYSFAAVAGLMLLTPKFDAMLKSIFPHKPDARLHPATLFAASLGVEVVLMPLIAYHDGRVSLVSPLANLIVIPLASPLIPTGLVQAAAGFLSPWLGNVLGIFTSGLLWVFGFAVHSFAHLPGAMISVASPPLYLLSLYYLFLFVWANEATVFRRGIPWEEIRMLLVPRLQKMQPPPLPARRVAFAVPASLVILTYWSGFQRREPPLRFTFIDVGQGDCLLVETPDGARMLVDGGGMVSHPGESAPDFDVGEETVVPYLRRRGIERLDVVALSHPHDDHVGGLGAVIESIPTRLVIESGERGDTPPYIHFNEAVHNHHIPDQTVSAGAAFQLGRETRVEVLAPQPPFFRGTHSDFNNNSVVLLLRYRQFTALLTGDIEQEAEARLLPQFGPVDLLKVAHHGSRFATSEEFVKRTHPKVAVASVGEWNTFGHPNPDVIRRLERNGAKVYRTDRDGAVTVETDGVRIWARTFLPPK